MTYTEESLLKFIEEVKQKGNDELKSSHFSDALNHYTSGIDAFLSSGLTMSDALKRPIAILYANRAQANLKLEYPGAALADADSAIAADATYGKAFFRRGKANVAMGNYKAANVDFRTVCKMEPKNAGARRDLDECVRLMKQKAFEDAIHVDEDSLAEKPSKQLEELVLAEGTRYSVPSASEYNGPRLSDVPTLDEIKAMREWFKAGNALPLHYASKIVLSALKELDKEESLVNVPLKDGEHITVVGDVHGQFFDLETIFSMNGDPSTENKFLFNGDFVDRGSWGCETVLTLFAYRAALPGSFFLNRGNHEALDMNRMYGFLHEVQHKYNDLLMKTFTQTFLSLPLAHVIAGKVFVVHGGLPTEPSPISLDEIRTMDRRRLPEDGAGHNLLWADPSPIPGKVPSRRGAGFCFGPDYTEAFLKANGLEMIVRSHEMKMDGYEVTHGGKLVTVFSAPNYCDSMHNKGAVVRFVAPEMKPVYSTFEAAPHPDIPPMAYLPKSYTSMMGM